MYEMRNECRRGEKDNNPKKAFLKKGRKLVTTKKMHMMIT